MNSNLNQEKGSLLKVAAYCRVSTDDEDQAQSYESQIRYFTEYINRNASWSLVKIYADEGITGTSTKKRKEFNSMIEAALNGDIDLIITKEVSRFARNTVDTLSYTRKLKAYGIGVYFINDNIDTRDNDGEFRLTIMASVAQEESRKTSSRVKWGMQRQMERGYVFANTIYGFDVHKGSIKICEEEAGVVRLIFHKFVYEGKGALTIAKDLIDENIPVAKHKRMKRWSAIAVTRILKNEKYVGDLLQKKTYTPNFLEQKSVRNDGQEEKVFIKNNHEGIISREIWNLAQQEMKKRATLSDNKTRYTNRYWCSGKIFCSECGSGCVARTKNIGNNKKYKAWRCKEVAVYGKRSGCTNGQINIKAIEACLQFSIRHTDLNCDTLISELHDEIMSVQKHNDIRKGIVRIESEIKSLGIKKEKIIDLMLEGTLAKEEMVSMKNRYDAEISQLRAEMEEIKSKDKKQNELNKNLVDILNKIKRILNQDEATGELYRQIVDKIIMYPSNDLDIYLKFIPEPIRIHFETSGRGSNYKTICNIRSDKRHVIK